MADIFADIEHTNFLKKYKISWIWSIAFAILPILIVLSINSELDTIIVIAALAGVLFAGVSIIFPKVWVYSTILMLPLYLISRDTDVNPMEIAVYTYILSGLLFWFISILFVKREKIVNNIGDFMLILFIVFAFFNIIIAYLNDVDMFSWFKEYSLYTLYLLYFPYRYYIKDKKDRDLLLIFLSISLIIIASYQLNYTRQNVLLATYAYQLLSALRINLTILAFGGLLGIVGLFYFKHIGLKVLMGIQAILSIAVVVTSFARTTWIIELFLIGMVLIVLNRRQRIITSIVASGSLVLLVTVFFTVFSSFDLYLQLISKKFLSTTDGKKDISVMARMYEYEAVWRAIEENPFSGNGIAKVYAYKDILTKPPTTMRKAFTHNSFLQLLYGVGIPTTIAISLFLLYYSFMSFKFLFTKKSNSYLSKFYPFLAFSGFFISITHSLVSSQLIAKETIILIVISCLLTHYSILENSKPIAELNKPI